MGATYTRQSSYSDGDTITAAHTNDEFNQLLAAFASSSGHTHDGTTAEGGPITKLLGNTLTFGAGTAGTDITITFDGETSDGVMKWMEDEDYFEFSDDILVASTEKLQFRDTAIYINSSTDGQLDLVADTEIQIAATTIDMNGALDLSGNLTVGGSFTLGGVPLTSTATELNLLDGVSGLVQADFTKLAAVDSTATELNIVDGNTSIGTTAVSDGHGIVMNHGGTMAQTTVQTLAAYLDDEITAMPNLVSTGALNSGSITSGFGAIDNGSSAITTTGTVTYGSLSDGSITITAFVDEDDMSSNSATLVPTQQSVKAYVDTQLTAEDLDVTTDSGTIDIDLDSETLTIAGGTGLSSSASSTTVTMAVDAAQTGITSVVNSSLEIGRDADNRIKFGTDNQIIFEVDGGDNVIFKTSGEIEASSLDISGGIDVDGTSDLDNTDIDGTLVVDGSNISLDSTSTLNIDNSNTSNGITIGTATSGVPVSIGHSTSEVTVNDNLTVTGNLTVSGDTTTVDTTNTTVKDTLLGLNSGASSNSNDVGIIIERGSTGNDALFMWDESEDKFALGTTTDNASSTGNLNMTTGTLVANIEGNLTGTASTATVATTVTITDNESTNEDNAIIFTAGGDVDGGNIGLESDGDLTYNPSTGRLTATQLSGTLQTAAQTNITSVGTLTGLTTSGKPVHDAGISVKNGSTSAGFVEFFEDSDNGTNKVTLIGPSSTSDITLTLPSTAGTVATTTSAADEATALAIALG